MTENLCREGCGRKAEAGAMCDECAGKANGGTFEAFVAAEVKRPMGPGFVAEEEQPYEEYRGCECEQDWNCGCGRYGGATWLETRYQDDYEDRR